MKLSLLSPLGLVILMSTSAAAWNYWNWPGADDSRENVGNGYHYHCDRPDQPCKNGGDCYSGGKCYCPRGDGDFIGYDCGINITGFPDNDIVYGGCPCKEDVCYRGADGENLHCICPPDYFGEECSKNRVDVDCNSYGKEITFYPIEPFKGIAYVGEDPDSYDCRLYDYDYYEDERRLWRHIEEDEACNLTMSIQSDGENSNVSYTHRLTIQYHPLYQSVLDLIIDVTCSHLDNGSWVTTGSFGTIRGESANGKEIESAYFPVKLAISFSAGDLVDRTVYIGRELSLQVDLTSDDLYGGVVVESCTFSNSEGDTRIKVIEDGCPTEGSIGMSFSGPRSYRSGVSYGFRAIRFGKDPVVKVSCRVKMCKPNSEGCSLADCDNLRRRKREIGVEAMREMRKREKRQAGGEPDKEGTIYDSFTVLDPYEENGQASEVRASDCLKDTVVKSVGISLVVTLVILVLLCICLALCVCRLKYARKEIALKLRYSQNKQDVAGGYCNDGYEIGVGGDVTKPKGM